MLVGLLAAGLAGRQLRRALAARTLEPDPANQAAFEAGVRAYRATGIDEPIEVIDLNVASAAELQQLSGVGPVLAKKIIDYRRKNGYFPTVEELLNVDGVGPKRLERWKSVLMVRPETVYPDTAILTEPGT